ncbi:hypothetical protein MT325_M738L [Paramecium bursaria chlorella virus MT325]|jgi:hypothetical protein|uniref:Uncharacterized protein M738L n=1 Tax=Paramecium bursaria Chlorella virus MT325 TaxID=346932 RepID=A7IVB8_PBCVM|nr:hypothetical protein MT325_M738L [Paramecium bursaria chlorella virus MT325]AGE49985.1 transposase [Paramecium bursaria Chlorella virus Can18-4]
MLSALIRVHGKEHQDISSIIPCVVQKKSVKTKPPKENDKKSASKSLEKKPRKPRTKKVPVQPEEEKSIEYSEFVPMKAEKKTLPASYKDDEDDDADGDFMAIAGLDDDDDNDKYENIDKMYRKRDVEWANMMEEAAAVLDDADGISDADVDGSVSSSHVLDNDVEGSVVSDLDIMDNDVDDNGVDDNDVFLERSDDVFFERQVSEPKIKTYNGQSIFKDDDYIP